MRKLIKGYLLNVKVTEEEEISFVKYHIGHEKTGGTEHCRQKNT